MRLLVECCRAGFSDMGGEEVARLARKADPQALLHLARRHRVQGFAWSALKTHAPDSRQPIVALGEDADTIARNNLRAAQHCSALQKAGLPMLFVKGLTLGTLAYRQPFLKMSWDIDILVAPETVTTAAALLKAHGFECVLPGNDELEAWHDAHKESVWSHSDGTQLELHTRLADHPALIPGVTVHSPQIEAEVAPGIQLPTLARDELFAYLCVHGASSAWFRLKWIADLTAFIGGERERGIDRLYERSQQLGAGRSAAQALLLADHLFGLPLSSALRSRLQANASNRRLLGYALTYLQGSLASVEPTAVPLGTARIHLTQFLLLPDWAYKWAEARTQARNLLGMFRR